MKAETFSLNWWEQFARLWNQDSHTTLAAPVVFAVSVGDTPSTRLEISEAGQCSIGNIDKDEQLPSFHATSEVWRRVLSGAHPIEKAVLTGDVQYVGSMAFLSANWDVLRSVVATGARLSDGGPPPVCITPTDLMIYAAGEHDLISTMRDYLGMKVEAETDSWTSLRHPETGQCVVIALKPLPHGNMALACRVSDIDEALAALSRAIPPPAFQLARREGFAQVTLYGAVGLLLYEG